LQYEVRFSDTFISDEDAESHLARISSTSSTDDPSISTESHDASLQTAELSQRRPGADFQDSTDKDASPPSSYEQMILNDKPYLCSIPAVTSIPTNTTTQSRFAAEEATELARATDRGYDLLKSMSGSCLYFISGWWSYSFCYNAHVKQFHQLPPGENTPRFPPVEDPATPSYVLGKFGEVRNRAAVEGGGKGDREAGLSPEEGEQGRTTEIQAKGTSSSRYLSQKLSGGTTCDLTGNPRWVEIQFHCHPQSADRIGWIKEVSTCNYLMVVYTPRLCNDVAFLPPREERAEAISCREVVKEEDVPAWEARKAQEAQTKLVGGTTEGTGRPIVGDIEVGGMALVGREGRRLELPPNMQPGSHNHGMRAEDTSKTITLVTQDAKDEGGKIKRLNDKELRAMELDPGVVEAARRELEDVAAGKGWRLEVFETQGGGRELRGIVEGEGEEEGDEYRGDPDGGGNKGDGEEPEGSQEEYKDEL